MPSIFLVTLLSCSQVNIIVERLKNIAMLSSTQKEEIVQVLKKEVPTCPVIIKKND